MKKLIILLPILLMLVSCETKQDWEVTVTTRTIQRNIYSGNKISDKTDIYSEIVVDMSEKEIKLYCEPTSYSETYGTNRYEYFTTKTYVELK